MKHVTLTLTQVNAKQLANVEYQHTITMKFNPNMTLTFGQLVGQLNFKFFKSVMAMRHSGNKGFSFNNPFHFEIKADGHTLCNTIELSEDLKAKVRMSNTIEGQKRFARLMGGMLYSAFGDDFHYSNFGDYEDTTYVNSDHCKAIRQFMDTQVVDIID